MWPMLQVMPQPMPKPMPQPEPQPAIRWEVISIWETSFHKKTVQEAVDALPLLRTRVAGTVLMVRVVTVSSILVPRRRSSAQP